MAVATLTTQERGLLAQLANYGMEHTFWFKKENLAIMPAVPRLLDKQLIRTAGSTKDGNAAFRWTRLGKALAMKLDEHLPVVEAPEEPTPAEASTPVPQESAEHTPQP